MKVIIQTKKLVNSLKTISGIKADLIIQVTGDIITLIKADNDTTLKTTLIGYSYENGSTILSHELTELLKKLKDDELTLVNSEIQTKNKVIKYEQKLTIDPQEEPIWKEAFTTNEKELHRMLEVKYAVAKKDDRPVLCGVYFNKNETCATDGYRLSVRSGDYAFDESFVVNKNTIGLLDNILDVKLNRIVKAYCSEEKVKFVIGSDIEVIGNIIPGEFIKYKSIISDDPDTIAKVNLSTLRDELNFIDKSNFLKLRFINNELSICTDQCREEYDKAGSEAKTDELQIIAHNDYAVEYKKWLTKKLKAEKDKKPFKTKCPKEKNIRPQKIYKLISIAKITSKVDCNTKFAFHDQEAFDIACSLEYLKDGLKTHDDDEIEFRMKSCVSPITITNDGKNLELILPIRIRED